MSLVIFYLTLRAVIYSMVFITAVKRDKYTVAFATLWLATTGVFTFTSILGETLRAIVAIITTSIVAFALYQATERRKTRRPKPCPNLPTGSKPMSETIVVAQTLETRVKTEGNASDS